MSDDLVTSGGAMEMQLSSLPTFEGNHDPDFRPVFMIDSGAGDTKTPGSFLLNGVASESAQMVFIATRETRTFYAQTYEENPDSPLVCSSCDGFQAFGSAERGSPKDMTFKPRVCAVDDNGKRKHQCPQAIRFDCRPCNDYLVLVRLPAGDTWIPAFFRATGSNVKPAASAFNAAKMKSKATEKQVDGRRVGAPTWLFAFCLSAKKNTRAGYTIHYSPPEFVDKASVDELVEFMQNGTATRMWDDETDKLHAQMMTTGEGL